MVDWMLCVIAVVAVGNPAVAGGCKACSYSHQVVAVHRASVQSRQLCVWLSTGNTSWLHCVNEHCHLALS